MLHPVSVLISPKPNLVSKIEAAKDADLNDMGEPSLWTAQEADRSSFRPSDREALVKLLFVDTLMRERSDAASFKQVFDGLSATIAGFDRFWTLLRFDFDTPAEDALEELLGYRDVDSMIPTGSDGLDDFLIESKRRWLEKNG